jgi:hypothetical protein
VLPIPDVRPRAAAPGRRCVVGPAAELSERALRGATIASQAQASDGDLALPARMTEAKSSCRLTRLNKRPILRVEGVAYTHNYSLAGIVN